MSMNFEALHVPTSLVGTAFSNPSMDNPFTQMLANTGINTLTIETYPSMFRANITRFQNLIAFARSIGLKIHILNQYQDKGFDALAGMAPPFSSPPTLAQFETYEVNAMTSYMSVSPDYLSVLVEPASWNSKLGTNYTAANLVSLGNRVVNAIPAGVVVFVDGNPLGNTGDAAFLNSMLSNTRLNAIGIDVYDNFNQATLINYSTTIRNAGKQVGWTETWWEDLYAEPQFDKPSNEPSEAAWFGQTVPFCQANGFTSYSPFFTNKFINTTPLPVPFTAANVTAEFNQLYSDLLAGARTSIYTAYQNIISGGPLPPQPTMLSLSVRTV